MTARSPYGNGRCSRECRNRNRSGRPNTKKKRPMLLPRGLPGVTKESTQTAAYVRNRTTNGRRGWAALTPDSASPASAKPR
jgi:hypothetical protein